MNKILMGVMVLLIIGGGIFFFMQDNSTTYDGLPLEDDVGVPYEGEMIPVEGDGGIGDGAESLEDLLEAQGETQEVIGQSVEGRDIVAYHFGTGVKEVLFIGGTHGGYSWNTALVAQQALAHFSGNVEETVPEGVMVTIIPLLNPDGLAKVVDIDTNESFTAGDIIATESEKVAARFNSNKVDLNRNFDCQWQETGTWQSRSVSGGSAPFSEPESKALKAYVDTNSPDAVVVWYSSAGGVYASQCGDDTSPETLELTNIYAKASGYTAHKEFDFYEVTGDMVNWLAKEGVPSISVLLTDKENTEWSKNKAGIQAVLKYIAQ